MNLELLPPKQKQTCPDCKRKIHLEKCKDGIYRCGRCKRRIPTNKYYVSPEILKQREDKIGKFSLSESEQIALHDSFMNSGMNSIDAWNKVHQHIAILRNLRRKRNSMIATKKYREKKRQDEKEQTNRKFLEGLR